MLSVSSVGLLAGCDFTQAKNPFGPGRPDQMVEGQRRTPIFNQSMMKRIEGNSDSMVQPVPQGPPPAPEGNFMSRMLGSGEETPTAQAAAPMPMAAASPRSPRDSLVRKPIPGNPTYASAPPPDQYQLESMAAAQSAGTGMSAEPPAVPQQPMPEPQMAAAPAPQMAAAPVEPPRAEPAPRASQSLFSRIFGSAEESEPEKLPPPWKQRQGLMADNQPGEPAARTAETQPDGTPPAWADRWVGKPAADINAPMQAEQNAPYPSLSSVPPAPVGSEAARAAGQQNMQDLQSEQAGAQQQRQALYGEPSQQQGVTPVEMPPAPPPSSSYYAPAEPQTGPGSPRRGVDIMTQEEWDVLQRAQQQGTYLQQPAAPQQPAPTPGDRSDAGGKAGPQGWDLMSEKFHAEAQRPAPEAEHVAQAETASEKPSFFARIFGSREAHGQSGTNIHGAPASDVNATSPQQQASGLVLPEPQLSEDELRAVPATEEKAQAQTKAEEKTATTETAGALPVVQFMEPSGAAAQAGAPAAAEETAAKEPAKEKEQAAEDNSPRDWLQALVTKMQDDKTPAAPESAQAASEPAPASADAHGSFFISPAYADTAASAPSGQGGEKELLGQIKAPPIQQGLKADEMAQPEIITGKSLAEPPMFNAAPAPEANPAPVQAQSETAAPEKEPEAQPRRRSLFSRIFGPREETSPAVDTAQSNAGTELKTQEMVQPETTAEPVSPAMAAVMKKPDMAPAEETPAAEKTADKADKPMVAKENAPEKTESHDMMAAEPVATPVNPVQPQESNTALSDAALSAPAAEAAPEPQQPQRRSLFSRIFGSRSEENKADETKAETKAEEAPAPAEPKEEAADTLKPATGVAEGGPFLPPLSAEAAPVMPVTTGDRALSGAAEAKTPGALPSPKILQEIKMLPPSRYSARSRAVNSKEEN